MNIIDVDYWGTLTSKWQLKWINKYIFSVEHDC